MPAALSSFRIKNDEIVVPPPPPAYDQVAKEDRAKPLDLDIPVKEYKPQPPMRLAIVDNTKEGISFRYAMPKIGKVIVYLTNTKGEKVKMLIEEEKHEKGIFGGNVETKELKTGDYFLCYETSNEKDRKGITVF